MSSGPSDRKEVLEANIKYYENKLDRIDRGLDRVLATGDEKFYEDMIKDYKNRLAALTPTSQA
jgi:hypothetical protein